MDSGVVDIEGDLALFSAPLGRSLGPYSITLTQQKLESGSDDSGCVRRIKMIPKVFFLNKICVDAKLDFNFLHN